MRKSLWIILAVMVVAVAAPAVRADGVFAITFSGTGAPTVVGSNLLDYNSTLGQFTTPTLEILFDGMDIILDNAFENVAPSDPFEWLGPNFDGTIEVIDECCKPAHVLFSGKITSSIPQLGGFVTLTEQTVPTPEPSSYALMLLGVGLVFVMRKRIGQSLPQAS
jgi:PEP-CTERM motif